MPDNVSFNDIPHGIRVPGVYIEIDPSMAVSGLPDEQRRIVVWGQRLATGTVAAGVPTRITGPDQGKTYFGRGSMLARMLTALFGTPAQYSDVWAIAVDDAGGGVAATKTITIGGTVTAAGTLALYVAGVRIAIAVPASQAAATTATALAAAITAAADLPVTAAAAAAVVTLTARNKGECGQTIDVRTNYYTGEALPAGLTATIANVTSGSGNPTVSTALAAMTWNGATVVINPWTDATSMAAIETEQATRWGPLRQIPLWTFSALSDTFANLGTWGNARNGPWNATLGIKASPTWSPEAAAIWGGVCAYYLAIDPARPLHTLACPGLLAPAEADRFTWSESNLLAYDGISTLQWGADGTGSVLTSLSHYQVTPTGLETTAFLKIQTSFTVHAIRYQVRRRIAERFPRHKLADDSTRFAPGQAVVTPRLIKAELIALGRDLEEVGLVESMGKDQLLVVRSTADSNRVNAVLAPNIVNQFDVFAASVQFRL